MTAPLESVAAVVLASRGGARLARALESVAWAGERIVLDPAGRLGAEPLPGGVRWGGDPAAAAAPWLLLVEEHEAVGAPLAAAIAGAVEAPAARAYRIAQEVIAFGTTLRLRCAPVRLALRAGARLRLRTGLTPELVLEGARAPELPARLVTAGVRRSPPRSRSSTRRRRRWPRCCTRGASARGSGTSSSRRSRRAGARSPRAARRVGSGGAGRSPCWAAIARWLPTPSSGSCAGRRQRGGGEDARVVRSPALGCGARRDPRGPGAGARILAAGATARAAARCGGDRLGAWPRLPHPGRRGRAGRGAHLPPGRSRRSPGSRDVSRAPAAAAAGARADRRGAPPGGGRRRGAGRARRGPPRISRGAGDGRGARGRDPDRGAPRGPRWYGTARARGRRGARRRRAARGGRVPRRPEPAEHPRPRRSEERRVG